MILADTNFWLALSLSKHVFHEATRNWMEKQQARGSVLFCRSTQQSLLRLLSAEAVMRPYGLPPMSNAASWAFYERLRGDTRIGFADEPAKIEAQWQRWARRDSASPKLWMDAYLAAFAMTGGLELVTTDRAFKQFKGLEVIVLGQA